MLFFQTDLMVFTGNVVSPSENKEKFQVEFDVEPQPWGCFAPPALPTNALDRLAISAGHSWKVIGTQIRSARNQRNEGL